MVRRWTRLVWSAVLPALVSSLAAGRAEAAQPVTPTVLERLRAATVFLCVYEPRSDRPRASGTGFLVSPQGEIVAPLHLMTGPGQLQVILNSGRVFFNRSPR
jgi:S1-C subfamily serine protease